MHQINILEGGNKENAAAAVIFIHGRGGSASDIMELGNYLPVKDFYWIAPQATNQTWYPYSFMMDRAANEPWLTSALNVVESAVASLHLKGFKNEQIYFVGFSQGACLTLEYISTHADRYAGVIAFIGGLIGQTLDYNLYTESLKETPVYIATSDPDPHVPRVRVKETVEILTKLDAVIKVDYFKDIPHTITREGLQNAIEHIFPK